MGRYQPTAEQQAAIDALRLAGYAVVRQRTYDDLRERVRLAEVCRDMEFDRRRSVEEWARRECDEQRRLADRLNEVAAVAASEGVSIQRINDVLARGKGHE